jgi:hypothetical protein
LSADGVWSPAAHVLGRLSSYAGCPVSVLHWPSLPRAVGILIEATDRQIFCFAHPRDDDHELSLPQGAWQFAERLAPNGFVESSPAAFRAERFGVSWLARQR